MAKRQSNINLLHISDLQAGNACLAELQIVADEKVTNLYLRYAEKLAQDAKEVSGGQVDILAFTGDIAQTGNPTEYKKAKLFLIHLVELLGIPWTRVLIVPGNHDVNRLDARHEFEKYHHKKRFKDIHLNTINSRKMGSFKRWFDSLYKDKAPYRYTPCKPICFSELSLAHILIIGLDSCERQSFLEKDNYGFIGQHQLDQIKPILQTKGKGKIKIIMMHHNPLWLEEERNGLREFERVLSFLENNGVHLILAGHMHRGRFMEHLIYKGSPTEKPPYLYTLITGPCCMQHNDRIFKIKKITEVLPNRYQLIRLTPIGRNIKLETTLRKFTFERMSLGTFGAWTKDTDLQYADDNGKTSIDLPGIIPRTKITSIRHAKRPHSLLVDLEKLAENGTLPDTGHICG